MGALLLAAAAIYFLVRGLGLKAIRDERSFDLMVLLAVLILPQLAAIPVRLIVVNTTMLAIANSWAALIFTPTSENKICCSLNQGNSTAANFANATPTAAIVPV